MNESRINGKKKMEVEAKPNFPSLNFKKKRYYNNYNSFHSVRSKMRSIVTIRRVDASSLWIRHDIYRGKKAWEERTKRKKKNQPSSVSLLSRFFHPKTRKKLTSFTILSGVQCVSQRQHQSMEYNRFK